MNAERRLEFMERVEAFKSLGLSPLEAISATQAIMSEVEE